MFLFEYFIISLYLGLEGQVRISLLPSDLGKNLPAQQGHKGLSIQQNFFPLSQSS